MTKCIPTNDATLATPATHVTSRARPVLSDIERAIERRSFATLATVSPAGRPHAAGVIYAPVDGELWVSIARSSRKARNIAANPQVHLSIPVRRLPVGPPSTIQFAATARLLGADDPAVAGLIASGRLKAITSHGEADLPDGCFVRIVPGPRLHTYGLGLPLITLIRHPLEAGATLERSGPGRRR